MNEPVSVFLELAEPDLFVHLQHFLPDQILPRIVGQNFIFLRIHNDFRNLLRFLVCGAPILCQTLRLASFVMS
jgi:hypothetical protein